MNKKDYQHIDYWNKLSKEEKEWLNKFNKGYHEGRGTYDPEGPFIQAEKNGTISPERLKELRTESYKRNYDAKNDILHQGISPIVDEASGEVYISSFKPITKERAKFYKLIRTTPLPKLPKS